MQSAQQLPKYPLSVHHFHKMIDLEILYEDEPIELIEGELITMAPIGPAHSAKVRRLNRVLSNAVKDFAIVDVQNPVTLGEYSEPQPDLTLLRMSEDYYETENPKAEDVLLLIEIADSSLRSDKHLKIPLYARHGIVEIWLFDVNKKRTEVYLQPSEDGYRQILYPDFNASLSPCMLPEIAIPLKEIWK